MLFYRAHELSGNTAFVDTLCEAIEAHGANALPVYCGSLRGADAGLYEYLGRADALIATVLAAGGTRYPPGSAGGDEESWDIGALADLDVPVLQGLCLTSSRAAGEASDAALSPMDAAMQVAIPEFDGRLITVPFSARSRAPTRCRCTSPTPARAARVAGIAVRHAALRHKPNAEKKLALVFTAYPTKHSRVGNAVGLDTHGLGGWPGAGRAAGRRVRADRVPVGRRRADPPADRGGPARRRVADRGATGRRARAVCRWPTTGPGSTSSTRRCGRR
ncbi:hypothetical protein SFUMM280S_08107 [Streptomyces fumanus]